MLQLKNIIGAGVISLAPISTTTTATAQSTLEVLNPGVTMSTVPLSSQNIKPTSQVPRVSPFANIPQFGRNILQVPRIPSTPTAIPIITPPNTLSRNEIDRRKRKNDCATACHPHTTGRENTIQKMQASLNVSRNIASQVLHFRERLGNECIVSLIGKFGVVDTDHSLVKSGTGVVDRHDIKLNNGTTLIAGTQTRRQGNDMVLEIELGNGVVCRGGGFDTTQLEDFIKRNK